MASLITRKEAATKSIFSSPSYAFKKLVGTFPKSQRQQQKSVAELIAVEEAVIEPGFEGRGEEEEEEEEEEQFEDEKEETGYGALDGDAVDDEDYSGSSEGGEYPRPRIREDLLPHDFSEWQKSPCNSSVARYASSSSEASSSTSNKEATENFSEVVSSSTSQERQQHLCPNGPSKFNSERLSYIMDSSFSKPDLRVRTGPDKNANGFGSLRDRSTAGLKALRVSPRRMESIDDGRWRSSEEDWEEGRGGDFSHSAGMLREMMQGVARSREGGGIDKKLYKNLVDMFPLLETFAEQADEDQPPRSNFQHHASMVYTRAPLRDAQVKKVADSRRSSRNCRRGGRRSGEVGMWEEPENVLRRWEGDDSAVSISHENAMEMARLQSQVEQLQRKVAVREGMLQAYRSGEAQNSSEVMALSRKVEELQRMVAEKEIMWRTSKEKLVQKEAEILDLQRLLQITEGCNAGLLARSASTEEELGVLRCEVAALQWQVEMADAAERVLACQGSCRKDSLCEHEDLEMDLGELESARKMYMAALVVARLAPGDESLALVRELRLSMQSFLRRPTYQSSPLS